jgi:hypothetical protein
MKNKFFTFIEPALGYIDNGHFFRQPFRWLYAIIAVLNLLVPIFLLIGAIDSKLLKFAGGGEIVMFILAWLVMCGVAWFSFQLWWDRKEKVYHSATEKDDFVAIPVFSHLVQTAGECAGLYVGIGGALLSLLGAIFASGQLNSLIPGMGNYGLLGIIICPIIGFLIVVITRVIAEMYRALASIANNTKKK